MVNYNPAHGGWRVNSPWEMIGDPGPEGGQAGVCHKAGNVVGGWKMWGRGAPGAQCGPKEFAPYRMLGVWGRGLELGVMSPFL